MQVRPRVMVAVTVAVAVCAVGVVAATGAAAASCGAITISQGRGINFDVSSVTVAPGGCVRFANLTDVTVTVTVSGSSFSEKLPPKTPAYASRSYTAYKSATVTATDGVRNGHGTITVESASASPTSAPASTAYVPPASGVGSGSGPGSGAGALRPPANVASTLGPYSVAAPPPPVSTQGAVSVVPVLPSLPHSRASAPATASHPVVAPRVRTTDPRFTSTVLEPVGSSGRGLPAVVAVVVLLGLATAYARAVLVAAPAVDARTAPRPAGS